MVTLQTSSVSICSRNIEELEYKLKDSVSSNTSDSPVVTFPHVNLNDERVVTRELSAT